MTQKDKIEKPAIEKLRAIVSFFDYHYDGLIMQLNQYQTLKNYMITPWNMMILTKCVKNGTGNISWKL